MKHQIARILLQVSFLAVVTAGAGVAAHGQSLSTHVRAEIPFDFTVGDKKFPAGKYSVGRAQSGSDDTLLEISSVDGSLSAFQLTSEDLSLARKGSDTLVFHQYGDRYFLYEVWPAGGNVGRTLRVSRSERAVKQDMAKNK